MKPTFPPRSILAALDGSPASWSAFSAAQALAAVFASRLEAVYVQPVTAVPEFEAAASAAAAAQKDALETLRKKAGAVPLRALSGMPAPELLRAAHPPLADLLVMGTHGRSGAERLFLGSATEAVFHRARVPVLAVREGAKLERPRVLVPCNLERYADDALLYAAAFAARLDAALVALYVAPERSWGEEEEQKLRRHLAEVLGPAAPKASAVVRYGDSREQIALEAAEGGYGLLALSAHHRGQLTDLALGTTAERLLRRCGLPILAVPDARTRKPVEAMVWK